MAIPQLLQLGLDSLKATAWSAAQRSSSNCVSQYAVALLIPLLGAALCFLSSDCSVASVQWRKSLRKSSLSPGAASTAVVWLLLYVAMGHASYIVYMAGADAAPGPAGGAGAGCGGGGVVVTAPLVLYLVMCLLNHFYIIVLFGLQRIDIAFVVIIPVWVVTALNALLFYDVDTVAGTLISLVLVWVSINVYLNWFLIMNNNVYTRINADVDGSTSSSPVAAGNSCVPMAPLSAAKEQDPYKLPAAESVASTYIGASGYFDGSIENTRANASLTASTRSASTSTNSMSAAWQPSQEPATSHKEKIT